MIIININRLFIIDIIVNIFKIQNGVIKKYNYRKTGQNKFNFFSLIKKIFKLILGYLYSNTTLPRTYSLYSTLHWY